MNSALTASAQPSHTISEKLYMENTLLRVAGALFCHDAKRAALRTKEIVLDRGYADRHISIRLDPMFGQPGPLAHKIFVALIKKHSDYGRPIQNEVSFTRRELMRLIGRSKWVGSASEQLSRALNEIHHTFIRTSFKTKDNRSAEHSFNIFPEIYLERASSEHDPIERCTVTLARPIIASLQDDHFTCLNHALMRDLGTIGQALFMRLFFHFANHYDGHHKSRLSFSKRYSDLANEWLGGLTILANRSSIERDQLGPHLRQLVAVGFLASYTINMARNGDGHIITFRPGATFFADYDRYYRHRQQGEIQFRFHEDQQVTAEPLKVAYLFVEKRDGTLKQGVPWVPSRDMDTARELLTEMSFAEIERFIEYGLNQARKTKFDVQTLGGLKQYLGAFRASKMGPSKTSAVKEQRSRDDEETDARLAYDQYRRVSTDPHGDLADAIIDAMPAERTHDVCYLNVADTKFPVGFNPLAGVTAEQQALAAAGIVSAFKHLWRDSWGPRLEHFLFNGLAALLATRSPTLMDLPRLYYDDAFREDTVRRVTDPIVARFWRDEFASYDQRFRAEAAAPILNKVGQIAASPVLRNIVGQTSPKFDLAYAMNHRKILIANLAKGQVGEQASNLLGSLLVSHLQLVAMARSALAVDNRARFAIHIDEFQSFSTDAFSSLLSESRKFGAHFTLANQYLEQVPDGIRAAVLGNAGTLLTFRVSANDADILAPEFHPLPAHELADQRPYRAWIRRVDGDCRPVFLEPVLFPSRGRRVAVVAQSRRNFGRAHNQIRLKV